VCPLSVLSNWQTQIEEHTAGNLQVRVCIFLCCLAGKHSLRSALPATCKQSLLGEPSVMLQVLTLQPFKQHTACCLHGCTCSPLF
jgi:hypothetical protein